MDDHANEPAVARALVTRVASAIGTTPSFDGLFIRGNVVRVVNGAHDEEACWIEAPVAIVGPDAQTAFVSRPDGPGRCGIEWVAARGCGQLETCRFDCGCSATHIPYDANWQITPGDYCRFRAEQHLPDELIRCD